MNKNSLIGNICVTVIFFCTVSATAQDIQHKSKPYTLETEAVYGEAIRFTEKVVTQHKFVGGSILDSTTFKYSGRRNRGEDPRYGGIAFDVEAEVYVNGRVCGSISFDTFDPNRSYVVTCEYNPNMKVILVWRSVYVHGSKGAYILKEKVDIKVESAILGMQAYIDDFIHYDSSKSSPEMR